VAPDPAAKGNEQTLIDYWTKGTGAAKIRWGVPGDFDRCVDLVTVEAHGEVPDVKGYCANLHHKAIGVWPGQEDKKAALMAAGEPVQPTLTPEGMTQITMPSLVTIPGVDLVAAGEWPLSSGDATFTTEDLMAAVDAAKCPAVGAPVIKLGHVDPRFDGQPAVGRVLNLALAAQGNKITGDLAGMPGWLAAAMNSAYPNRSIEGCYDYRCQVGHLHPFVLTGLALLGVTPPGVGVLSALGDVAVLYGVQAAASTGSTWTLEGAAMAQPVMAAGTTTEDVRRAYYAQPGMNLTYWITEMQLDPPQLIVCDEATDNVYRVPVTISASDGITFGDPVMVKVEYADVAAGRRSGAVLVYANAADSRAGVMGAWSASTQIKNLGDDPAASKLKAMFALPGDTKSDSSLPHHDVSTDGTVGAANPDGCSAAIGAINGAQGGLKDVSEAQARAAYNHLAAHLTAAGKTPPDYSGPGASTSAARKDGDSHDHADPPDPKAAAAVHDPFTGTHTHSHDANGSQGGDATHEHEHTHSGDADHGHSHPAAAGPTQERGLKVDFTDEQNKALRAALGLAEDAELTPDGVITAAAALREQANQKVAAAGRAGLPEGTIIVEKEAWDGLNKRVDDGEAYRKRQAVKERDTVIASAIGAGKFSVARRDHWARLWDADPEGTRQVLAGLQKNVVPVGDIGAPGTTDPDDVDEEYRTLFGTGTK
jgi:hypothetical protein